VDAQRLTDLAEGDRRERPGAQSVTKTVVPVKWIRKRPRGARPKVRFAAPLRQLRQLRAAALQVVYAFRGFWRGSVAIWKSSLGREGREIGRNGGISGGPVVATTFTCGVAAILGHGP